MDMPVQQERLEVIARLFAALILIYWQTVIDYVIVLFKRWIPETLYSDWKAVD